VLAVAINALGPAASAMPQPPHTDSNSNISG
jgi:hypothetical protein